MAAVFISDLHLDETAPDITARCLDFLQGAARGANALYVLGDLFEAYLGDDDRPAWREPVLAAFRGLAASGTALYFLPGNRDFLLGEAFGRLASGAGI